MKAEPGELSENFDVENDIITPLYQARAIAKTLVAQRESGFKVCHEEIINTIWGIEALIDNALGHLHYFGDKALNMKLDADKLKAELLKAELLKS